MKPLTNYEIAKILREMAILYEMEGTQFKPRAYEKAAIAIESFDKNIGELYKQGGIKALDAIPSVGFGIAKHIESILKTGTFKEYERLKKKIPVNLEELTAVQGLGPKMVKALYQKLKIKNLKGLEAAASAHKIRELFRFGEKTEQNILRGISFLKKTEGRFLLGYLAPIVAEIEDRLKKIPGVGHINTAGSFRRKQETVGDIDILITAKNPKPVMDFFVSMPEVAAVYAKGQTKSAVRLKIGIDADVRVVPDESYGAALQYFTGSKDHNIVLRKIAISQGYKLNEYGLFKNNRWIAGKTEEEIYQKLGMTTPPPEIRTNAGEIEASKWSKRSFDHQPDGLPRLIPYGSIQGDLQVQTNWSDGSSNIEEMARAAQKIGLKYIAITDHTRSLAMTGGLDEKDLARQGKEIDKLNQKTEERMNGRTFKIFKSAEVNILKDGKLDIADSALKKLDIVSIAVHSNFKMSKKEMTERIIKAMKNPYVNILFHPTGRVIKQREEYEIDIDAIIKAAKRYGVALEIDAFPDRLDLRDSHIKKAISAGVKLVIDSDAHNPEHFKFLDLGISQARRGWAGKSDVLNTLPADELIAALKALKKR